MGYYRPMRLLLERCTLDLASRTGERDGAPLTLSRRDWELLSFLAERIGVAVSREQLLTDVLGYAATANSRALDAAISRIRSKIEARRSDPVHLVTVYGYGYRLDGQLERAPAAQAPQAPVRLSPAAASVRALCEAHGQVTLLGPPGVGKTHLALQLAAEMDPGAVLVDLADPRAIIADRDGLLILDGAHHGLERALAFLDAPHRASVLVTSRERLQWPAEVVFRVPELPVDDAVALFVEQAARIGVHDFDPDERRAIARVATLLDGIPLAIRYAATRTLLLRPSEMVAALERDLRLVRSAGTGAETLAAAVDWTWERLEPWEREVVAQLSVFEGGFTLGAASRVLEMELERLVDVVQALVDRCLCRRISEGPRFSVYRAIREFASDRLTVGSARRLALQRWIRWCAEVASKGPEHPEVHAERANLQSAAPLARLLDPSAAAALAAVDRG